MSTINIESFSKDGQPIYAHLNPIVEFLMAKGFLQKNDVLWQATPDGWICRLVGNFSSAILDGVFLFPSTILVDSEGVFDFGSRAQIIITDK